ncbi:MAG: ADP-ribosylglycohydrolase family protein [Myxococcales bacterium]|nr:ADP-ribosylglycohydrolase family protein [Myxococcales bacterium]
MTPAERADRSLRCLRWGDCFGESFFFPSVERTLRTQQRRLAEGPWPWTDDTAQAAVLVRHLRANGEVRQDAFAQELAEAYLADPRRGYGANAHDLLKAIAAGEPWQTEAPAAFDGTGSMGNGAAMRVAPLGAWFADDLNTVVEQARRSAEVTHANNNGIAGAIFVALAAAAVARGITHPDELWELLLSRTTGSFVRVNVETAARLDPTTPVDRAAAELGSGFRVCAHDTVGFALWCAFHHGASLEEALWTTVAGLGDMDTTCAIVGGILGASGRTETPSWVDRCEPLGR